MTKPNWYFNFILTVIAFCLLGILVQNQMLLNRQVIVNQVLPENRLVQFQQTNHQIPQKYAFIPVNKDGSIDVNLKGLESIDVNISRISTSDELDINIDEVYGSSYGKLKVENDK